MAELGTALEEVADVGDADDSKGAGHSSVDIGMKMLTAFSHALVPQSLANLVRLSLFGAA